VIGCGIDVDVARTFGIGISSCLRQPIKMVIVQNSKNDLGNFIYHLRRKGTAQRLALLVGGTAEPSMQT